MKNKYETRLMMCDVNLSGPRAPICPGRRVITGSSKIKVSLLEIMTIKNANYSAYMISFWQLCQHSPPSNVDHVLLLKLYILLNHSTKRAQICVSGLFNLHLVVTLVDRQLCCSGGSLSRTESERTTWLTLVSYFSDHCSTTLFSYLFPTSRLLLLVCSSNRLVLLLYL